MNQDKISYYYIKIQQGKIIQQNCKTKTVIEFKPIIIIIIKKIYLIVKSYSFSVFYILKPARNNKIH